MGYDLLFYSLIPPHDLNRQYPYSLSIYIYFTKNISVRAPMADGSFYEIMDLVEDYDLALTEMN